MVKIVNKTETILSNLEQNISHIDIILLFSRNTLLKFEGIQTYA